MITLNNLKIPLDYSEYDIKCEVSKILGTDVLSLKIIRRAVDARKKNNVFFVYNVDVEVSGNEDAIVKRCHSKDIFISERSSFIPLLKNKNADKKIIVVGSGPAGLFASYVLAKSGLTPIVIERGKAVDERREAVELFKNTGILNTETNIQFGEGGAGTFSDGKLNTGVKDKRIRYVLETFAEMANGTADDILYMAKPHVGTDRLINIVRNMRNSIISLGGKFLFEHKFSDIIVEDGNIRAIEVENENKKMFMPCDVLVLATGHSARDTFKMLHNRGIYMEQKPYAVGVRIEHKRSMIDKSQYGEFAGHRNLGAADYKISCTPDGMRGVYSFCMCPGGVVVPASSEVGCLAVNGMSEYKRDAENSNAALLVGIAPEDLKSDDPLAGIELQRQIESKAYALGGGGYKAPVQMVGDLLCGKASRSIGDVVPSYLPGVTPSDLRECLPDFVIESIKCALPKFGRMIEGYDRYDAVLTGVESRSSSPVRIKRCPDTLMCNVNGIYPCGEGAGYAGGIVSAAVDGIRCAEAVIIS